MRWKRLVEQALAPNSPKDGEVKVLIRLVGRLKRRGPPPKSITTRVNRSRDFKISFFLCANQIGRASRL